jgi:hypothetical protein
LLLTISSPSVSSTSTAATTSSACTRTTIASTHGTGAMRAPSDVSWHQTGTGAMIAPTDASWHPTGTGVMTSCPTGVFQSGLCWQSIRTGIFWPHPTGARMPCDVRTSNWTSAFTTSIRPLSGETNLPTGKAVSSMGTCRIVWLGFVCGWATSVMVYLAVM